MPELDLFKELSVLIELNMKFDNQQGENFNLISLLGMERDEVRTHSRIVGDLLNPKGSHGQGGVF